MQCATYFDRCKLKMKVQGPTAALGEQWIVHVPLLQAIYSIGLRLGGLENFCITVTVKSYSSIGITFILA